MLGNLACLVRGGVIGKVPGLFNLGGSLVIYSTKSSVSFEFSPLHRIKIFR